MDLIEHLFNPLLNDGGEVLYSGEVLDDLGEHNKRVPENRVFHSTISEFLNAEQDDCRRHQIPPDGHEVLALQADDEGLDNLVVIMIMFCN